MRPVVVVGDVGLDVIVRPGGPVHYGTDTPARVSVRPGGAGGNTASWLAASGTAVCLFARVGADAAAEAVRADLRASGVTALLAEDADLPTCSVVVLAETSGERTMFPDRGANARLAPADVDLTRARWDGIPDPSGGRAVGEAPPHLHLSSYVLFDEGSRAAGLAALAQARALGWTTSVDPQAPSLLARVGAGTFLRWVEGIDLLLPNAAEADALGGAPAMLAAVDNVVVTYGSDGAGWVCRTGSWLEHAPHVEVVDPTGAGDAFDAGLLAAWLDGANPQEALRAGVRAGSAAVSRVGARPESPAAHRRMTGAEH
ncbi:MAG: carbohydrate kinase family protein [Actinomycetales bacterium]|nr:carbohydrate kinase family protein [Actinomycetales bacterium]